MSDRAQSTPGTRQLHGPDVDGWDQGMLSEQQAAFVSRRFAPLRVIEDMSWGQVDTVVLRAVTGGREIVVKAGGPDGHHIGREITAHESYTEPLLGRRLTGRMLAADRASNVLVTEYLPGTLVEGGPVEFDANVHRQAGEILAAFHGQSMTVDADYEQRATAKALVSLGSRHRIDPPTESQARLLLRSYRPVPVETVPTHGDWQPRNWLIDGDTVKVIDFGRFEIRPPSTDLCRLAVQQWRDEPALESAFFSGYGTDPRDGLRWSMDLLREAIGTAVWAHHIGDTSFEAQGHQMLKDALARF